MSNDSKHSVGDVLVVDDDPVIIDLIVEVLTEEGYTVRSAYDGRECLRAIADARPALLLLDIQMPGLSGIDVLTQVRAAGHDFPITVITATPQLAAPVLQYDRVEYMAKPFDLEAFINSVARYVALDCVVPVQSEPAGIAHNGL